MLNLLITVADYQGREWTPTLTLTAYTPWGGGKWKLDDAGGATLLAAKGNGRFRRAGTLGEMLVFWDRDETAPAFILYEAPLTMSEQENRKKGVGEILNQGDPAGRRLGLEWTIDRRPAGDGPRLSTGGLPDVGPVDHARGGRGADSPAVPGEEDAGLPPTTCA